MHHTIVPLLYNPALLYLQVTFFCFFCSMNLNINKKGILHIKVYIKLMISFNSICNCTVCSCGEKKKKRRKTNQTHHKVSTATEHFSRNATVGATCVFGIQHITVKDKKHRILALHLLKHHALTLESKQTHPRLFTTQLPWTSSATCWMQRSTAVESVPEASSPIRLANGITLTISKRKH